MKRQKRLIAVLLAIVTMLALCVPASATSSGTSETKLGSITIQTRALGNTYGVYRIFELESYSGANFVYKYNSMITGENGSEEANPWNGFINSTEAKNYVVIASDTGYVTPVMTTSAQAEEFAKAALAYATENNIKPDYAHTVGDEIQDNVHISCTAGNVDTASGMTVYSLKFQQLPLGYYIVDSTVGTAVAVDTTSPDVTITAKNTIPTIKKQVYYNGSWGSENTATIGTDVRFWTSIELGKGATTYVLHDEMDEGFTLKKDSLFITLGHIASVDSAVVVENGKEITYKIDGVEQAPIPVPEDGIWYTVRTDTDKPATVTDSCSFEVVFSNALLDAAKKVGGAEINNIFVYYTAELNEKAVIGKVEQTDELTGTIKENDGNTNTTWLTYGQQDPPTATNKCSTETYTYKFELVKVKKGNASDYVILNGAEFTLSNSNNAELKLIDITSEKENPNNIKYYRVASSQEQANEPTVLASSISAGRAIISGVGNGTYNLTETKAPDGFRLLSEPKQITIKDANNMALQFGEDGTYKKGVDDSDSGTEGIVVLNLSGTILPSTGGAGTKLLIGLGCAVAAAMAILLVTKRRMYLTDTDE